MIDRYGRTVDYLRISVTDRCNLRCRYCMPEEGVENIGHEQILSFEEIEAVVRAAAALGFCKIRLTGGEPLVRRNIVELVERIAAVAGIEEIAMTSNGVLLPRLAGPLRRAGLNRINISLDSLKAERYREITRGGELSAALDGIRAAEEAGLTPIRLNAVVVKGLNDDEIGDFAALTFDHPWDIRFIELMPIGHTGRQQDFLSAQSIRERLANYLPVADHRGVARYYQHPQALGRVGLISPISAHFCGDCNKIRLTADGRIKPCLHSNQEIDLRAMLRSNDAEALERVLETAVYSKEERHRINDGEAPIRRDMNKIGG